MFEGHPASDIEVTPRAYSADLRVLIADAAGHSCQLNAGGAKKAGWLNFITAASHRPPVVGVVACMMVFGLFYTAVGSIDETADNKRRRFYPAFARRATAEYIDTYSPASRSLAPLIWPSLPDAEMMILRRGAVLLRRNVLLIVVSVTIDTVAQIQGYLGAPNEGDQRSKLRAGGDEVILPAPQGRARHTANDGRQNGRQLINGGHVARPPRCGSPLASRPGIRLERSGSDDVVVGSFRPDRPADARKGSS